MRSRLQVVIAEDELARFREVARMRGMTLSEWVRQVLRTAERQVSTGDVERKLAAIDRAARFSFPIPDDVEEMNAEIARGYEQNLPGL